MSNRIRWYGTSSRPKNAEGFILDRARAQAAEPHDEPLGRATREQRIRALVRAEVRCGGDKQVARLCLMPSRIVAAVDRWPAVPPSGLRVERMATREDVLEARGFRESKWEQLSEDERIVADELRQETLGQWSGVFRTEESHPKASTNEDW